MRRLGVEECRALARCSAARGAAGRPTGAGSPRRAIPEAEHVRARPVRQGRRAVPRSRTTAAAASEFEKFKASSRTRAVLPRTSSS